MHLVTRCRHYRLIECGLSVLGLLVMGYCHKPSRNIRPIRCRQCHFSTLCWNFREHYNCCITFHFHVVRHSEEYETIEYICIDVTTEFETRVYRCRTALLPLLRCPVAGTLILQACTTPAAGQQAGRRRQLLEPALTAYYSPLSRLTCALVCEVGMPACCWV